MKLNAIKAWQWAGSEHKDASAFGHLCGLCVHSVAISDSRSLHHPGLVTHIETARNIYSLYYGDWLVKVGGEYLVVPDKVYELLCAPSK